MTLRERAEQKLGTSITAEMFAKAKEDAEKKRARIIEREGDENGERNKQYYLASLIAEIIQGYALEYQCLLKAKEKACRSRQFQT